MPYIFPKETAAERWNPHAVLLFYFSVQTHAYDIYTKPFKYDGDDIISIVTMAVIDNDVKIHRNSGISQTE